MPPVLPVAVEASEKRIAALPPASAKNPVTVTASLAPRATFSGASGCKKPGRIVSTAVAESSVPLSVAVTATCARSAVR